MELLHQPGDIIAKRYRIVTTGKWQSGWGKDNDILTGVDPSAPNPGLGEVDILTSGQGKNKFVLGDAAKVYYNKGNDASSGINDYALILDFNHNKDVIGLHGSASNYILGASPVGLTTGTAVFQKTFGQDELIGIVQEASGLNLGSRYFSFVWTVLLQLEDGLIDICRQRDLVAQ